MRKVLTVIFAAGLFVPLEANYKMGTNRPVKTSKTTATKSSKQQPQQHSAIVDETPVLNDLSQRFSVKVERLRYYRDLKNGYEELVPALIVAREAQVEIGQVLQSRMEGESWNDIAARHSIELKPLNAEVVEILEPIRKTLPKKMLTERPRTLKS